MQPVEFIRKWKASELTERAAAHSHFNDLCALLDEPTPTDADQRGTHYCFERGVTKTTGDKGWADVWKRECFAWEYKGKHKDLTDAFVQLQRYAIALENPPLLVVCDFDRIRIHTNWTNSVSEIYEYTLDELGNARTRETIKCLWSDPEKLKPGKTRAELTEEAAGEFATLAQRLRSRGHSPEAVAHFINRLVFCMFAEDAGLLPDRMFKRMLEQAKRQPDQFPFHGSNLFRAMKEGGWVGFEQVDWFNGGLFDDDSAIPLDTDDLTLVERAADLNWSEIDTSIFGTLFERGLDPDKRSQLGAHYTDVDKIRLIVEPVITRPLLVEWVNIKSTLASLADTPPARRRGPRNQSSLAAAAYRSFLARLRAFRVLDPACGSGNFLYVALLALKDIERQVAIEAEAFGFEREFPHIGPEAVLGIEINPYAAELARVTVWIGEIQWMRRNGFNVSRDPILKPLNTIECRDAVLNDEGTEALWPDANVVIGNPPFLGAKLMKGRLGLEYTDRLRNAFRGRLAAFSDLVCFWFEKARQDLLSGRYERAGLVATSSIRGGTNRPVLDRICENLEIYDAHGELPWTVEGARVEVSIICFAKPADALTGKRLDGQMVEHINADLTAGIDLTTAKELPENRNVAFIGIQKTGPLDVPGELARTWMQLPTNPNGRENREILKPYYNGDDITGRVRDQWTIDFPLGLSENEASQFQTPFEYLRSSTYYVSKERPSVSFPEYRANTSGQNKSWWEPHRPRPAMRTRIESLSRYIVTPEVSEHRIFVWLQYPVLPDKNLIVITRDDDTTFGILQSRFHELWALRLGTSLEDRPRYTSTTTFATFPFPSGLNPNRAAGFYAADPGAIAIADAARRLDQLRQNWLYPTRQIRTVPEIVPGFPDRLLPADEASEALLKGLTLTALYNEKPTWLRNAHRDLDAAVAAAYGWSADISDDEALTHLLELNHERASAERPQDRRPAPQRLQREPELPPMPIPGGVPEQQPVPTEPPIAQPVAGRIRRRRSRSSG